MFDKEAYAMEHGEIHDFYEGLVCIVSCPRGYTPSFEKQLGRIISTAFNPECTDPETYTVELFGSGIKVVVLAENLEKQDYPYQDIQRMQS